MIVLKMLEGGKMLQINSIVSWVIEMTIFDFTRKIEEKHWSINLSK